ncbi:hypothetical protein I302_107766 [Kwoniella bestiolae CBS 10118]|uniref:Uncharacterized protein n=1 Tax=Kwoniella bestiolae CBS 10118 TaxID=1296100 RepID=A0A1B9FXL5_9TREE|nr:hypothetical protein I302_06495 [Kwoniella bestiolae CBS 10118]OCF23512.1 hypothetical protein I302_06495 [Kwoniella bestiolae CBS 10118]
MPLLPSYQKHSKSDEESLPLFDAEDQSHNDELPAYPPRVGESSGTGTITHNVTYTFVPRWPIRGDQQDALGVLGETKEETIAIVQRGFPLLATYPPHRIEFLSPVEMLDAHGRPQPDRWGKIMDEAWVGFRSNPPQRLRVQVADAPGDEERRKKRENFRNWLIVVAFITPLTLFFCFIGWILTITQDERN